MNKYLYISATVFSLLYAPLSSAAGEVVGVNSAVKGDVNITDEEAIARQAVVKDRVRLGEEVNSQKFSTLQILLNDQTVFTVGPECVLTIDEFVYDPSSNSNNMTASVKKGMFRFMSGNIAKGSSEAVTIDSPVASMGVRGTIVEGLVGAEALDFGRRLGVLEAGMPVDPEGATLFILRGPGQNTQSINRTGEIDVSSGGRTVTISQSGMATLVPAEGVPPVDPFMLPDDVYELFSRQLRTQPQRISSSVQEPIEIDYFNPITDMDWPEDHGNIGGPGNPGNLPCNPQNPIWPNC